MKACAGRNAGFAIVAGVVAGWLAHVLWCRAASAVQGGQGLSLPYPHPVNLRELCSRGAPLYTAASDPWPSGEVFVHCLLPIPGLYTPCTRVPHPSSLWKLGPAVPPKPRAFEQSMALAPEHGRGHPSFVLFLGPLSPVNSSPLVKFCWARVQLAHVTQSLLLAV